MSSDMLDDAGASEEGILLTPDDVARMMRVSRRTVSTWRYRGKGPRYVHVTHNCVRYRLPDVQAWIQGKSLSVDRFAAAYREIGQLFDQLETNREQWDQYQDGYTSGLAKALAIIDAHVGGKLS